MAAISYRGALRRLQKDLKELDKEPIPDASLAPHSDTLFELHGNLIIPDGPYKGLLVHLIFEFDESFPATSPSGKMGPDFPLNHYHHEHIYPSGICNDYLRNFQDWFKSQDGGEMKAGSGWSPGVTLKGLMMVMRNFFCETDLPKPSKHVVDNVFASVRHYRCCICNHTTKDPFPPLPLSKDDSKEEEKEKEKEESPIVERARRTLVCGASKENFVDSPEICLGYPVLLKVDGRNRLHTTLYPELTSYDQYIAQIMEKGIDKLDNFNTVNLRSTFGNAYTHWLPVFINEAHFQRNFTCIKNTISVISNGIEGTKENDFHPSMVVRVLPCLMNQMIVALMNGGMHESENAIHAFCHYLRLLMRFLGAYKQLNQLVETKVNNFVSNRRNRRKQVIPDLGEFLILLALSSRSFNEPQVQRTVLEEFFARQVFWINKKYPGVVANLPGPRKRLSFDATEVSLKLFMFDLAVCKWFIIPGIRNELDRRYGVPPGSVVTNFQKEVKAIKAVDNYDAFLSTINLPNMNIMFTLDEAIKISEEQGYTGNRRYVNNKQGIKRPSKNRGKKRERWDMEDDGF